VLTTQRLRHESPGTPRPGLSPCEDLKVKESIGRRLQRLRKERGLSQRELAEPGVSYAYISRIEAGARQPSEMALRALAPKLGVTTLYLESGSDAGVCPHCGRPRS
jgi:ribosome-binding protein aMBF1 (putative translation factor)